MANLLIRLSVTP